MSAPIEIENPSPRSSIQAQEEEDESTRLNTTITLQRRFIAKIYIISTAFLVTSFVQLIGLTHLNGVEHFARVYKYLGQFFVWLTFLALLCFISFFKHIRKESLRLTWSCAIVTSEMGTVLLLQPVFTAFYLDVLFSLGLLGLLTAAIVPLSLQLYKEIKYTLKFLQLWICRLFIISVMGTLMIKTLRDTRIEIAFASLTILPTIIFILVFGKSLGSSDLIEENQSNEILLGVLLYFNLSAVFSNALMFLTALRKLL